ncbi:MAG TPA: choice-of-anchor Q domain-containing protein [Solirubrobacteraceae bacterium]|nr:choice-of-anchor Q domain-containing protein [Solirubrobacteraceae bacterium]
MKKLIRGGSGLAIVVAASLAPWTVATGGAIEPATRYASSTSTDTTGACTESAPCRIDHAIGDATSGDRVIVEPGNYHVSSTLTAGVPIDLHGQQGRPFPHLIGDPGLAGSTLHLEGGAVSRLYVETAAPDGLALDLEGGTASQLILVASGGDHEGGAVTLESSPNGTVLRDSVARVVGSEGEAIELKEGGGTVAVVNVTAVGGSNTTGLESKALSATVENSVISGGAYDLKVMDGTLTARYSNFRASPSISPGVTDGGHNQIAPPLFVDAPNGDYHQQAGSPTIDAGVADPLAGPVDLDGLNRVSGPAPDIGAYEHQVAAPLNPVPASTPAPPASDPFTAFASSDRSNLVNLVPSPSSPAVHPTAGHTVVAGSAAGTALVQLPGSNKFVPLSSVSQLPVGTVIDARSAVVWLFSASDAQGTPQDALMYGSEVKITQRPGATPMTDISLTGGDFSSCPNRRARGASMAKAASGKGRSSSSHHVVRRLWALDHHGRFRTHGVNSVATVRGTVWRVDDRCDGTLTKVFDGQVLVHDRRTHTKHLVTAHHHYVAYN